MTKQVLLIAFLGLLSSCYYDKAELLQELSPCDTTSVSFSNDLMIIFSEQCETCHSGNVPAANISLTNHAEISNLSNEQLFGVIQFENGYSPMPKNGPKLDNCSIDKIKAWVNNGKQNN